MSVSIRSFVSSKIEIATKVYNQIEKNTDKNVVLVSATSFNALRMVYPNYFADISYFINKVQNIIKKIRKSII